MEIAGYIAAVFIGISLGLIGGGGSTLTVPVLVYMFGVDAVSATAYSLFVVGTTSVVGSVSYFKKDLIHLKTAVIFGAPSILTIFLTRRYILPAIPDEVFRISHFVLTKNLLLLLLFALLMIASSVSMIKGRKDNKDTESGRRFYYVNVLLQGALVGFVAGMVGAGGGFLIIPVLVTLLKLPMKTAVGTSLLIISVNSLLGFFSSLSELSVEWRLLLFISAIAIVGIMIGSYLSTKIEGGKLKPAFGWFILLMGIGIILKELLLS